MMALQSYMRLGVFPYRDHEWKAVFDNMKKKDPEHYNTIMKLAELEHQKKGVLRQLFGRPTPVKVWRRFLRQAAKQQKREHRKKMKEGEPNAPAAIRLIDG